MSLIKLCLSELDLAELKQRAFGHIVASLSVDNIVDEVFGGFAATFADVRKVRLLPSILAGALH